MRKVKITLKQSEFIDKMHEDFGKDAFSNYMRIRERCGAPLDDMDYKDVAIVFNGWYEIVDTYEVGDYVFDKEGKLYCKIINVSGNTISMDIVGSDYGFTTMKAEKRLEKVSEPWKIKLLDMERSKPEFKNGDKITIFANGTINNMTVGEENKYLIEKHAEEERIQYFYPVEARIPFRLK